MIISRTPFRISFFGGGTDYPVWYGKHGGAVLSTTIDKYCYITCRWLPPFFPHKHRIVYSLMENVREIDEIDHPAVREVFRYLGIERGLEIHHDADLPARSGLGSSSAFTVGLLHTIYALQGRMMSKRQLARQAIHVEQDLIGENVGSQDQVAAAYGGLNHIRFTTDGDIGRTARDSLRKAEDRFADPGHVLLHGILTHGVADRVKADREHAEEGEGTVPHAGDGR